MESVCVPEAVQGFPELIAGDIRIVLYSQNRNHDKSRVVFNCNAVSFVLNGRKEIYYGPNRNAVDPGEATVIPEGNSLIAERSFDDKPYCSLVAFFPTSFVIRFLQKLELSANPCFNSEPQLKLKQTPVLKDYIHSIQTLITGSHPVSEKLVLHKLEELLLILYESHSAQFANLLTNKAEQQSLVLKNIVENNLLQNLTLEELAFLAHKSLSSFKRDFEKAFGVSPGRYIRERKLELASTELIQGKTPSEIYLDYGYESLSNFIHAFRKRFNCTPKEYVSQALAV